MATHPRLLCLPHTLSLVALASQLPTQHEVHGTAAPVIAAAASSQNGWVCADCHHEKHGREQGVCVGEELLTVCAKLKSNKFPPTKKTVSQNRTSEKCGLYEGADELRRKATSERRLPTAMPTRTRLHLARGGTQADCSLLIAFIFIRLCVWRSAPLGELGSHSAPLITATGLHWLAHTTAYTPALAWGKDIVAVQSLPC